MSRKWFALAPVVSLVLSATVAATKTEKGSCVLVKEWLTEHAASLPTTYEKYAKTPPQFRQVAYSHLTASDRKKLWRAHLQGYLASSRGLTDVQRAFVRRVMQRVPLYIDQNSSSSAFQGQLTLEAARRLFGRDETAEVFLVLAPGDREEASAVDLCNCADQSNCGDPLQCQYSNCEFVPDQCLTRGESGCTGQCRDPQ